MIFEDGWTMLAVLGFSIEFSEEAITLTKHYGSVTVDDVKTISTYVKPEFRHMVFKSDYQTVTIT